MSDSRKFNHVSSFDEVFSESSKKHLIEKRMSFESTAATFQVAQDKETPVTSILSTIFTKNSTKITEIKQIGRRKKYFIKFESYSADGVADISEQFNQHPEIETFAFVSDEFRPRLSSSYSTQSMWFPRSLTDLDICSKNVLMYGTELDADHPGFKDEVYRKRRQLFTDIAINYKNGEKIPYVEYTEEERKTWNKVYNQLMALYPKYACKQFLENLPLLSLYCDYSENNIPQLEKVSQFLQQKTGFRIRPVAGFLSPRDFLAGLAFRVFSCTQYIRHSSDPFYTPEPDVCHELLGHVPLLANPQFARYSQEIGLASLGATDEDISKLAACYLYTNEFGLCKEKGQLKAYGAGLLSSISELEHAMNTPEKIVRFDPIKASTQEFFVTTFQPVYFASENFDDPQNEMRKFFQGIRRPFSIRYDPFTSTVHVVDSLTSLQEAVESLSQDVANIKDALSQILLGNNFKMR